MRPATAFLLDITAVWIYRAQCVWTVCEYWASPLRAALSRLVLPG